MCKSIGIPGDIKVAILEPKKLFYLETKDTQAKIHPTKIQLNLKSTNSSRVEI